MLTIRSRLSARHNRTGGFGLQLRPSSVSAGVSETDIHAGKSMREMFETTTPTSVIFLSHSKILLATC